MGAKLVSLKLGQLAADSEFFNTKYTDVFTNASMGWPAITSVDLPSGGPSPPLAAMGARVLVNVTEQLSVLGGIFDGDQAGPGPDDPQLRNRYGVNFRVNDPPLLLGQLQYAWNNKKGDPNLAGQLRLAALWSLYSFISRFRPAVYPSRAYFEQAQALVAISARLTDKQKMIAEYWADGPHTELPPGHWDLFAQFVSARDRHTVDDDAKMFFVLTAAIHDAGIAAWAAKSTFDSVRPATAIPFLFRGQTIMSWGGPFMGTVAMDGGDWIPYQPSTFPTPPFPEYISGHSTFSASGAEILRRWTGSDNFGASVTFDAGTSTIEPGVDSGKCHNALLVHVHRRRRPSRNFASIWWYPFRNR